MINTNEIITIALKNRYRHFIFLWILVIMMIFTQSCRHSNSSQQKQSLTSKVEVYQVHEESFTTTVNNTGRLIPFEETEIRSGVNGHIFRIHFKEGQMVRRGDLLVEIDHRSWDARKRGLESRLAAATAELKRRESLLAFEGISVAEYEQTAAEVGNLKAQIEELEVMIDLSQIRAPFDGRIGFRDFSIGAYISQGALITRLVQNNKLKVVFSVSATYISVLQKDHNISITSSSNGKTAEAKVYAIDPVVNPQSGSIELRAYLDNRNGEFVPGDFVQVNIDMEQNDNAILIPAEAVISELDNQFVFIVKYGIATRKVITTGSRTSEKVQVTSGLTAGDKVITTGLMVIKEGDRIEISRIINGGEK